MGTSNNYSFYPQIFTNDYEKIICENLNTKIQNHLPTALCVLHSNTNYIHYTYVFDFILTRITEISITNT
jgi:hypothetical protein